METIKEYIKVAQENDIPPKDFLEALFFNIEYEDIDPSIFDDIGSIKEIEKIFPLLPGKIQSVARKIWLSYCQTSSDYYYYNNTPGWNGVYGPDLSRWIKTSKKELIGADTSKKKKKVYQMCPEEIVSFAEKQWFEQLEKENQNANNIDESQTSLENILDFEETTKKFNNGEHSDLYRLAFEKKEKFCLDKINSNPSKTDAQEIFTYAERFNTKKAAAQRLVELSK